MNWYKISQNDAWFSGSKVIDEQGQPLSVYHGTNMNFDAFDLSKGAQGVMWFTSDKQEIIGGTSGANSGEIIKAVNLNIKNPAGWEEYDKYSIGELIGLGFDGIILDNNYVVFEPGQIRIIDQNIFNT